MPRYVLYDNETGRIICSGQSSPATMSQGSWKDGATLIEGEGNSRDHYVKDGEIVEKEELDTQHTLDDLTVTFTALPEGITVKTAGESITTDGDDTVLEYDAPGRYTVRLNGGAKYLSTRLEVEVG